MKRISGEREGREGRGRKREEEERRGEGWVGTIESNFIVFIRDLVIVLPQPSGKFDRYCVPPHLQKRAKEEEKRIKKRRRESE